MNIVVFDPDKSILNILNDGICSLGANRISGCYDSSFSFVTAVYDELQGDVDLIICHASSESMEMIKDIRSLFPHILIIFYSDDVRMAESVMDLEPVSFLYIPLSIERLQKAIEKAEKKLLSMSKSLLTLSMRGKVVKLSFPEIRYLESEGRKIIIYSDAGSFETYMTMEEMQVKLTDRFYKCHRSYIVNLDKIVALNTMDLVLSSRERVPVSRSYLQDLKTVLLKSRGK